MMMHRGRQKVHVIYPAALFLSLSLTGCGSNLDSLPSQTEESKTAVSSIEQATDETKLADNNEPDVPALLDLDDDEREAVARLLGWDHRNDESLHHDAESSISLASDRQDFLLKCMMAQGFEYHLTPEATQFAAIIDPEVPYGTPAFVAKYGLGITTLSDSLDDLPPGQGLLGYEEAWLGDWVVLDFHEDPNSQYFSELDEASKAAYTAVRNGCADQAEEVLPDREAEVRDLLADELADIDERVKADERVLRLTEEVDACMEVEAFTFSGLESLEEAIWGRMIDQGLASGGEVEVQDDLPDDIYFARFGELQQFELTLAAEFERCIGWSEWIRQVDEIAADYRDVFVARHRQVLTSMPVD